ncbi:MAG: HAD-IC family P-type ATPase [Desulfomonilaceae bacterium]|nr:HAD-IC family P-type ATPase [Desulfomonilaceae bacterium]
MDWYKLGIEEALEKLKTSERGLANDEIEQRLKRFGPNRLPEEAGVSRVKILLHQFASPLIYMLIIAAVVTALLQEYKDTFVIFAVIVLNAVIGYVQEFKAEESISALKKIMVPRALVVRNGKKTEIDSENLVPGDVVLLESGNRVPADLRLIKTIEAKVDESILTGESLPVEKTTDAIGEDNLTPGDRKNMAFMGTAVVSGRIRGVVVETGSGTVLGSISERVREIGVTRAPLQAKFDRFANIIGIIVLSAASVLLLLGILIGENLKDIFMTAVAAAVATIPEGLPVVVTIALAISVARMARNHSIIRKLPAVETLGSTTVICSDKTGTLTRNEMTVKQIYDGAHVYEVTGSGYEPSGEILAQWLQVKPAELDSVRKVLRIGLLCNESRIVQEDNAYRVQGDPTEGALIVAAMKSGLDPEEEGQRYRQISMVPFESERGYMATLHEHDGSTLIYVKGAPEQVVSMCTACMAGDGEGMRTIMEVAENLAKDGLRVLAMAYKEAPADMQELTPDQIRSDLTVAGLQGMMDPPRAEAIEAVEGCRRAGIRVVMITGDHAITAQAVAKIVGIARGDEEVLTGRDLETMTDDELFQKVKNVSIYARVSPEHKLRITRQLIEHGEIVAVTGDGVNDAPALKAAHIGVAMGKTGTDVAKEASDMVVTDDNFASIFAAVKEGRIVFDNIRKVTFFLVPTGVAAILSIIGTVVMGLPIPYVPAQLLWVNLVTNGLQDVALAFEPGEKDVAERPPRDPREGIMSRVLIERTIVVGLIIAAGVVYNFASALQQGESLEKARTVAVTTMVFFQFFQAWNSRSEFRSIFRVDPTSNPFLLYALLAAVCAQVAFVYVSALQWVFRTEALYFMDWVEIIGVSSTVIVAVEIEKWLRRRSLNA